MTLPVSRRTTLKAGAHAAWAVPVISLAAATPAYATSGSAVLDVVTSAAYATDRPDILMVTVTITNTTGSPANGLMVSVLIPPGFYDSAPVVLDMPTFWGGLATSGDAGSGWTASAAYSEPLQAPNAVSVTVPIQFTDALTDPPYKAWAGHAMPDVSVVVTATNASAVTKPAPVAESALTTFDLPASEFHGVFNDNIVFVYGLVHNVGRKSTGDVTVRFGWNPTGDDPAWSEQPQDAFTELGVPGLISGGTGPADPFVITFTYGPTSPQAPLTTPEESAASKIQLVASVTLAQPPGPPSKQFFMDARAAEALEPVPGLHGYQTTSVSQYVPPRRR